MGSSTRTWGAAGPGIILVAHLLVGDTASVGTDSRAISRTAIYAVPQHQPRPAATTQAVVRSPIGGRLRGELGFFSNAHLPSPIFTTPFACGCKEVVTLTFTVTASNGISASDSFHVRVRDPIACLAEYYSTSDMVVTPIFDPCIDVDGDPCSAPSSACASPCITPRQCHLSAGGFRYPTRARETNAAGCGRLLGRLDQSRGAQRLTTAANRSTVPRGHPRGRIHPNQCCDRQSTVHVRMLQVVR